MEGINVAKGIQELPQAPDLLVIATPPQSVPGIVAAAGEKGAATAVIITAGLGHAEGSLADACEKAARATGLRLVGPNCLGVLSSRVKLNASFAARMPPAGELALVSQSGAITAGLIHWSAAHDIRTRSTSIFSARPLFLRPTTPPPRVCFSFDRVTNPR